jgi:hypothetical protein
VIDESDPTVIDTLPLDYSCLEEIEYQYPKSNAYMVYATRGCIRNCDFCTVRTLEPRYVPYVDTREQIEAVTNQFGAQKDLLLYDNNVLASKCFNQIINDVKALGFGKNAVFKPPNQYEITIRNLREGWNVRGYIRKIIKLYDSVVESLPDADLTAFRQTREERGLLYSDTAKVEEILAFDSDFASVYQNIIQAKLARGHGKARYVDFNQGVDARLLTESKTKKLAEINVRPLRIAFDHYEVDPQHPKARPMHKIYSEAVRLAVKYGVNHLSNYLLYNHEDTPDELYLRLQLNIELCEELNANIYSFPMKYHKLTDTDRSFIGANWNRKYIRTIQAIINATGGKSLIG